MNNFRKNLHVAYKQKMCSIILQCTADMFDEFKEFSKDPEEWVKSWLDKNCTPMGDFSKEDALKEMDAWQSEE